MIRSRKSEREKELRAGEPCRVYAEYICPGCKMQYWRDLLRDPVGCPYCNAAIEDRRITYRLMVDKGKEKS